MAENETNARRAAVLRVYGSALLISDGDPGDLGDVLWCQVYADALEAGKPIEQSDRLIPLVEAIARAMPAATPQAPLIVEWLAELRQAKASRTPATATPEGERHE